MKFVVIGVMALAIVASASASDTYECYGAVHSACNEKPGALKALPTCTARHSGIDTVEKEVQKYINLQLQKSYEYLLMSTYFNSFQKDRPGFQKLYKELSDRSFDDAIGLIKQLSRRGGHTNFKNYHTKIPDLETLDFDEVKSLGVALDNEKKLTEVANHVYNLATHTSKYRDNGDQQANSIRANRNIDTGKPAKKEIHDPEMAHYIEEKFLHKQADSIRRLSGYVNDLIKMVNQPDPSVAIYLFDEYLQKQ